jgi:uncharacterized phage protein gp47/JayE
MAFGVTDAGFQIPQITDIQTEINNSIISTFGANVDLSADAPFGQISGIFAEREYLLWAAMQDVYNSQYPNTAFGVSLDNVGSISGIPRLGPLPSTIQGVKLFGTAGTVVPGAALPTTSTRFSVNGSPNNIFQLDADVTLVTGQSCIQTISFSAVPTVGQWSISINGDTTPLLMYNANAAAVQLAIQALEFCSGCLVTGDYTVGFTVTFNGAGTGGFMVQPQFDIPDNTLEAGMSVVNVTTLITQAGIDQGVGNVTAVATGPTIANAGTLIVINTPVAGLTAVLNIIDATLGRNVESDNAYRARRATVLQIAGAGTFEAIRSRLLALSGVTAVVMFENVTLITDPNGLPPKSFEATVQGGDDQAIGNLIWQIKPAGILAFGDIPITITDSQGQLHIVSFSRPIAVDIYVKVQILSDPTKYPLNGDAAVRQAIVNSGNALGIGAEVVVTPYLYGSISSIPGIENAIIYVGLAPNPTSGANIPITLNQISVWDTSRVTVVHL